VPWSPNRCVFSNHLNSQRLSYCRVLESNGSTGVVQPLWNTDHRRCCVTVKQHTSLCQSSGVGAFWMSVMSWQSSARYISALLDRHWTTRTATLNWTRCRTGNQCSCRRIGVMWWQHHAPVTSPAAAFWTDCTCCSVIRPLPSDYLIGNCFQG